MGVLDGVDGEAREGSSWIATHICEWKWWLLTLRDVHGNGWKYLTVDSMNKYEPERMIKPQKCRQGANVIYLPMQ